MKTCFKEKRIEYYCYRMRFIVIYIYKNVFYTIHQKRNISTCKKEPLLRVLQNPICYVMFDYVALL